MNTESESSAVLKVQFHVKGQQEYEVVKKSTSKGFEVVEVNGAVFYRKRKTPTQAPPPVPCKRHHEENECQVAMTEQHPDADAGSGEVACADTAMEKDQLDEAELSKQVSKADAGSPMHRLARSSVKCQEDEPETLKDQLEKLLPPSCPKAIALQFGLEKLLMHGANKLDLSHGSAIYSQTARRILLTFAQLMQQQAEAAHCLLLQVTPMQGPTSSSDPGRPPATGADPAAGCSNNTADDAEAPLARYLRQAPMIRALSRGDLLEAHLQQQLSALHEEEQAWISLRQKYSTERQEPAAGIPEESAGNNVGPTAAVELPLGPANAVENAAEAAQKDAAEGANTDRPSVLKRTEETVNAALSMQVESLSSFLSKVDAIVAKGEQACMILQADYHQEKFKSFPHVNSPAWLIRQIISKQQAVEEPIAIK